MAINRFIFLLLCALLYSCDGQTPHQEDLARTYFENRQYLEALDIWRNLVQSGSGTAGVYYNLGLTQSSMGNTPQAMLAFEKALRLKPSNGEIKRAIMQEKEKMTNAVIPVEPFFLTDWARGFLAVCRPGYWALTGLVVLGLATLLYLRRIMRKDEDIHIFLTRYELIITVTGILLMLAAFLSYAMLYRSDEAILHKECQLRKAPSEESPEVTALYPGEKMVILDQLNGWYNVRLLNIEEGWIRADCLTRIEMGTP